MASRDRFQLYLQYKSERIDSIYDDDLEPLYDDDQENNLDMYDMPGWKKLMHIVERKMEIIRKEIQELHKLHKKHRHNMGDDDLSSSGKDQEARIIEAKTSEISQLFRECKGDIACLEQKNKTKEIDLIFNNLKLKLVNDLNELMNSFRASQQRYLVKVKKLKENRSAMSFGMEEDDDEEDEMINALAMDRGFTDRQKNLLLQNQRDVLQRDKELREILKSITELHEMFEDMNALIVEQGTMLDRIDYNISQAQRYMQQSTKNVKSAETAQKASGWVLCFILIIVVGVLAAVGIMIKLGIKYIVK